MTPLHFSGSRSARGFFHPPPLLATNYLGARCSKDPTGYSTINAWIPGLVLASYNFILSHPPLLVTIAALIAISCHSTYNASSNYSQLRDTFHRPSVRNCLSILDDGIHQRQITPFLTKLDIFGHRHLQNACQDEDEMDRVRRGMYFSHMRPQTGPAPDTSLPSPPVYMLILHV